MFNVYTYLYYDAFRVPPLLNTSRFLYQHFLSYNYPEIGQSAQLLKEVFSFKTV